MANENEITDWREHGAAPTGPVNASEQQRMRHEATADVVGDAAPDEDATPPAKRGARPAGAPAQQPAQQQQPGGNSPAPSSDKDKK